MNTAYKTALFLFVIGNAMSITAQTSLLPPLPELRMLENICRCVERWVCECCATIHLPSLTGRNESLCGVWQIVPRTISLTVNVTWNDQTLFTTGISPNDVPPICAPIVPPVLSACIKVNNVTQNIIFTYENENDNQLIGACTNATLTSVGVTLISFRLGCISVNRNGTRLTNIIEG